MSQQEYFARGYIAGRMDGLPADDEMQVHYRKWQVSTTFRESMNGLRALESFATDRNLLQLAGSFRTVRSGKEEYRSKNPACPVCDETMSWPTGDVGAETGYCFRCKREWSKTTVMAEAAR